MRYATTALLACLLVGGCGPGEYDGSPEAAKRVVRTYLDSALVEPDSYEEVAMKADTNFVVYKGGQHGLAPWRDTVSVKTTFMGRVDSEVDAVYRATNEFGGTSVFDEIFSVSPAGEVVHRRNHRDGAHD